MKQIDFIFDSGSYSLIVSEDIDKDHPELMNLFLQTKVTRISFENASVIINPTKLISIVIKDIEEFSHNDFNNENDENDENEEMISEEEIIISENLSENMISNELNDIDNEISQTSNELQNEDNKNVESENENQSNNEIIARIE